MKGVCLKFYTSENTKHHGMILYEWLLEFAMKQKIHGGSAFRGVAGFGRNGKMNEEHFFEVVSHVPIEVVFYMSESQSTQFLSLLQNEGLDILYVKTNVEFSFMQKK